MRLSTPDYVYWRLGTPGKSYHSKVPSGECRIGWFDMATDHGYWKVYERPIVRRYVGHKKKPVLRPFYFSVPSFLSFRFGLLTSGPVSRSQSFKSSTGNFQSYAHGSSSITIHPSLQSLKPSYRNGYQIPLNRERHEGEIHQCLAYRTVKGLTYPFCVCPCMAWRMLELRTRQQVM